MGRIADALKKAEQERQRRIRDASPAGDVAILDPPVVPEIQPPLTHLPPREPPPTPAPAPADTNVHEAIVPFFDRSSLISEQYRSLRTRLLTQNPQNDHRVIAITSAIPREGKSVTTVNLGVVMGEIRHLKVLCIDSDFRRSTLANLLGIKPGPGLADLLRGQASYEEVLRATPIPNLFVVPAGSTGGRPATELLSQPQAGAIFRRLQSDFHYTFVDTPPATSVTDVGTIGQLCSGVILLVRLNFTPEPAARRAVRMLHLNNIPILGCVLVGGDERTGDYGNSDSFYYYRYYGARDEGADT